MGKVVMFRKRRKWKKFLPLMIMGVVTGLIAFLVYVYVKHAENPSSQWVPPMSIHSNW